MIHEEYQRNGEEVVTLHREHHRLGPYRGCRSSVVRMAQFCQRIQRQDSQERHRQNVQQMALEEHHRNGEEVALHRGRRRDLDGEQFEQQYPDEITLEQAFHVAIRSLLDRAELEEHDGQEVVLRHARRAQSDAVEERFHLAIRNALHRAEVEEQNGGEVGLRHAEILKDT